MNAQQLHKATLCRVASLALTLIATVAFISGCSKSFAKADRVVSAEEGKLTVVKENGMNQATHEVAPDAEVILDGQPAALEELHRGDAVKLTTEKLDEGTEVVKKIEAKSKEALETDKPATDPLIDEPAAPLGPFTEPPLGDIREQPSELNDQHLQYPLPESDQPINREDGAPRADAGARENPDAEDAALAEESFSGKISSLGDNQFVIKDDSDQEHTFMVNDDTKYTLDGNEATFGDLTVDHSVNVMAEQDGDNHVATMVDATSNSNK